MTITFKKLLAQKRNTFSKKQIKQFSKAYNFSQKAHSGQKRKTGEEYFSHSVETAATILKMGLDITTSSAALLHDVPEDTPVTLAQINLNFGQEVAFLVDGVTKLGKIKLRGDRKEYYLNNLRKIFLAMATDVRVVFIKLADRLHNMKTLDALPYEKQQRIAKETMEIFAPIANRLGMGSIKGQLEDLCFKYLDPENYKKTVKLEKQICKERNPYTNRAIKELKKELKSRKIKILDIHKRVKHYYSFFLKLKKNNSDVNKIFDIVVVRIVVPTVADCYKAIGIIHNKYHPLVGRIKDYISLPKPNGYKSLHTIVFGPERKILEIQIRTNKMHNKAKFGVAANWLYPREKKWRDLIFHKDSQNKVAIPKKDFAWIKQLESWQKETGGKTDEFWSFLKCDFFKNHIFAFTPRGEMIDLPEKATPIDFAYKIHTEVGNSAVGVKINGKKNLLDCVIKNGDVVEIILSKEKKYPDRNWINFIKTSLAKTKIKHALREKRLK